MSSAFNNVSALQAKLSIDTNGAQHWRLPDGRLHREGGPAEIDDGFEGWWLEGKRHRVGGPAVIFEGGTEYWFLNGKKHREDGPAVEHSSDVSKSEWWLNGEPWPEGRAVTERLKNQKEMSAFLETFKLLCRTKQAYNAINEGWQTIEPMTVKRPLKVRACLTR